MVQPPKSVRFNQPISIEWTRSLHSSQASLKWDNCFMCWYLWLYRLDSSPWQLGMTTYSLPHCRLPATSWWKLLADPVLLTISFKRIATSH